MVPIKSLLNKCDSPAVRTLSRAMAKQSSLQLTNPVTAVAKIMSTDSAFTPPRCPTCGGEMIVRTRGSDQSKFWGCLNFRLGCHGSVDYAKWLKQEQSHAGNAFVFASQAIGEIADYEALQANPEYAKAFNRVSAIAYRVLNLKNACMPANQRILPWMNTPKVGLQGEIPAKLVETLEGCERVEKLLIEIYEKESGLPFKDSKL